MREIVDHTDSSLRERLSKAFKHLMMDSDTPEIIKTSLIKIQKENVSDKELETMHDNIKEAIKDLKNPERRKMLQYAVLQPIQFDLGKRSPTDLNITEKNKYLEDLGNLSRDKDIKQKYSEEMMLETKTKGAPSSQIKHAKSPS